MKSTDPITINGETRPAQEWAEMNGVPWGTVQIRHNRNGWPPELCVIAPVGTKSQAGRKGKARSCWNGQPFLRGSRGRNPV